MAKSGPVKNIFCSVPPYEQIRTAWRVAMHVEVISQHRGPRSARPAAPPATLAHLLCSMTGHRTVLVYLSGWRVEITPFYGSGHTQVLTEGNGGEWATRLELDASAVIYLS